MALFYVAVAFVVICINIVHVPEAFGLIFSHAFGWHEAVGGAAGWARDVEASCIPHGAEARRWAGAAAAPRPRAATDLMLRA